MYHACLVPRSEEGVRSLHLELSMTWVLGAELRLSVGAVCALDDPDPLSQAMNLFLFSSFF